MKRLFYAIAVICMMAPAIHAGITSVVPNTGAQGEDLTVTITGTGTMFGQGSGTIVSFEQGSATIMALSVNVSSTTSLEAGFHIPDGAPLGFYDVKVQEIYWATYVLAGGFEVVEPSGCGDIDGNGSINLADAIYLINYVFSGGTPPGDFMDADVNCDYKIDLLDISIMMGYLFRGGSYPCSMCL